MTAISHRLANSRPRPSPSGNNGPRRALLEEWKNFATYGELPTLFSTFSLLAENRHSSLPPGPNFQPDAQPAVARVVGFHHLALRAGVTAADFDRFMMENVARIDDYPGWKFHMLKGTGGNRSEQYAVMLVIESLDSLNSFHPAMDVSTEKSLTFVKTIRRASVCMMNGAPWPRSPAHRKCIPTI